MGPLGASSYLVYSFPPSNPTSLSTGDPKFRILALPPHAASFRRCAGKFAFFGLWNLKKYPSVHMPIFQLVQETNLARPLLRVFFFAIRHSTDPPYTPAPPQGLVTLSKALNSFPLSQCTPRPTCALHHDFPCEPYFPFTILQRYHLFPLLLVPSYFLCYPDRHTLLLVNHSGSCRPLHLCYSLRFAHSSHR